MHTEISAGGIILRKRENNWEVLLVQDRNDEWTFPKGKLEKDESARSAAMREVHEEVGITEIKFFKELNKIHYFYHRNGLISKTVHYFIFTSDGNEKLVNQKEEGIHNATWTPIDTAIKIIGYPKTNKKLLEQAATFL